uniref:Uncharacterized protein n=1 Tax=Timema genevievae TaxID=629358 RepID=A0A7R9JN51_TIMGE|nr:unnamed protein product [Timema genevievae]
MAAGPTQLCYTCDREWVIRKDQNKLKSMGDHVEKTEDYLSSSEDDDDVRESSDDKTIESDDDATSEGDDD